MLYNKCLLGAEIDMKPRIFVSSTFYDLKYIREDLSNFIKAHDFEPIMFEDGDIGYTPGKELDKSCYDTMRNSDMVVLVIGGQYGSPATGEKKDEFKEYMSVTRNEFNTAVQNGVPVFAFIESGVYTEYGVYESNDDKIESGALKIKFKVVKDINVFRFIKEIKGIGNISITEFTKASQIKDFLGKQWADMFKKYLDILKSAEEQMKLQSSMNGMKLLIEKMEVMIDGIGKKVMDNDEKITYKETLISQNKVISQNIGVSLCRGITAYIDNEKSDRDNAITILRNYKLTADRLKAENIQSITIPKFSNILFNDFVAACDKEGIHVNLVTNDIFVQNDYSIYLANNEIYSGVLDYLEKYIDVIQKRE